ncbi:MAG: PAS domain S-box protein, partial [Spirochaetota bacterium]|nr:PAS domain S-box protein [Spirochaetota bacterium]
MTIKPTYQELENRLNELECEIIKNRQIGDALRESEQNLSVTLDSIGDAMIATDVIGNVTRMNPVAQMLTGWDINDAIGLPITDIFNIVNAKTRKTVENPVKQVLREGRIVGLANHTLLISKDGSEYQIADSGSPIKTENGEMCGVVLVFRDVTKEYNIQQQLIESEELFRNLVETTGTGFCIGDANAKIIAANKEFLRIVGQKNINDVLNHYILDWTAPYDIKRTIEAFKEFQTKGAARNFDMDIVRSD